jgi:MarR family transcriptional regulator, lower aerobic nicotinate degradation pathway regulator
MASLVRKTTLSRRDGAENILLEYAGFLVRRMWQIHVAMFLQETKGSGMTPLQFSILLVLEASPDLEQFALAFRVGLDRSNLSEIVSRMTNAGLLKCGPSQRDRRTKVARLTKRGLQMLRRLRGKVNRSHARLLEDLPAGERADFLRMIKMVVERKNELGRARFSMRDAG